MVGSILERVCPRIQRSSHGGREDFSSLACEEFPGEPGDSFHIIYIIRSGEQNTEIQARMEIR